jgi:hypothetical protein
MSKTPIGTVVIIFTCQQNLGGQVSCRRHPMYQLPILGLVLASLFYSNDAIIGNAYDRKVSAMSFLLTPTGNWITQAAGES